jgi:hypothetical protein
VALSIGEYLPATQFTHCPDPASDLNVPAAHFVHEPVKPVEPGSQRQEVLPHCLSANVSPGHGLHAALPVSDLKKSIGHGVQVPELVIV